MVSALFFFGGGHRRAGRGALPRGLRRGWISRERRAAGYKRLREYDATPYFGRRSPRCLGASGAVNAAVAYASFVKSVAHDHRVCRVPAAAVSGVRPLQRWRSPCEGPRRHRLMYTSPMFLIERDAIAHRRARRRHARMICGVLIHTGERNLAKDLGALFDVHIPSCQDSTALPTRRDAGGTLVCSPASS